MVIQLINKYNDEPIFVLDNIYDDDKEIERTTSAKKITKIYWTSKFFNRHVLEDPYGNV